MKKRKEPPLSAIAAKRLREQGEELSEGMDGSKLSSDVSDASDEKPPDERVESKEPFASQFGNPQQLKDGLVFTLRPGEKVAILGQARLQVRSGFIEVDGVQYSAGPDWHTLSFPTCHSAPEVRVLPQKHTWNENHSDDDGAIFTLLDYSNGWSRADPLFQRYTSVWNVQGARTFQFLHEGSAHQVCRLHPSWSKLISDFTANVYANPVVFVAGPKGSGKSTFSQQLLHAYAPLEEVEYLETDCGQPQFTPSGLVSLCRAPSMRPFRYDDEEGLRGHHIGHVTAKANPQHYLSAIDDLFSRSETATCIVNLPGWIKGMGLEIVRDVVHAGLKLPSRTFHVVFLGSASDAADVVQCMPGQVTMHYIQEHRPTKASARYHAADLRALRMMSYFHYSREEKDWIFRPMCELPPKAVGYGGSTRDVEGVRIMEDVSGEFALAAVNGTVVAVIVTRERMPCTELNGVRVVSQPFDPSSSRCLGLALVRGVDTSTQTLYLTTPIQTAAITDLQGKGFLVYLERGSLDLPLVEMLPGAPDWGSPLPYLSMEAAEGVGAQRWRSRRNIQRRGQ